ncbi:DUF4148 domain-containing protein [Burkholderia sp. Ax-1724]|uniref:DUF4148 domain-containing protein n=1 Tax=Burkholderia sp. Ax-1724 TaxID=2608336 RepID=UPI001421D56B|nr:DUF4148 domain-containing protein [Burkholderia sp. Ax-1724]NIF56062.1 DUF4148 domain-containing protein [Burkholderia sp. Ax-1724]
MTRRLTILLTVIGLSTPLLAEAQTLATQGLTREQVRQEMAEYAAAGWNPARQNPRTWVDDAQAASAKVMTSRANVASRQFAQSKADAAAHCN